VQKSLALSMLAAVWVCTGCEVNSQYWPDSPHAWQPFSDEGDVEDFAERRARRSLRQLQDQSCDRLSKDFRDGYEQAYLDLAMGGNGVVPAVPPKKYWSAEYRTPHGRSYAYQWFAGYETGAAVARADGMTEFRAIPSSFDYGYACGGCIQQAGCQTCCEGTTPVHSGCDSTAQVGISCDSTSPVQSGCDVTAPTLPATQNPITVPQQEGQRPDAPRAPLSAPAPPPAPAVEPDAVTEIRVDQVPVPPLVPPFAANDFGHVEPAPIGASEAPLLQFGDAGHTEFTRQ